jgi:DNA polymerase
MISLDFETYYSKTYSLSKLTTEEYVNGDEFEVIGVGIKVDDKPTIFYTGSKEELKAYLDLYDIPNQILLCHNTFFDATILSEYFGITAKRYIDTLSMARAIHGISVGGSLAKLVEHYGIGVKGTEVVNALGKHLKDFSPEELARYGEYCVNDVEVTYKLFHALMPNFNTQELSLIDITIKMATNPTLTIDLPMLESYLHEVRTKKEDLLSRVVADKKELMSNPKFAALLEQYGVEPPMKVSPTTGKLTYAFAKTDDGLKDLLEHENPEVQALVATRLGVKSTIEETRAERFIGIAKRTNYLPIPLSYYGAATGRWSAGSGQKLNLQNLPRESTLKKSIVAPDGMVVVGADLSNIELRVGLWVCDEMEALKSLGDGRDLYKEFASLAFNVPYEEVTKAQRFIGKTSQLGLIFGVGAAKLRDAVKSGSGTDLGEMEAKRIVDLYRNTYTGVTAFWKTCSSAIKAIADDGTFTFGRNGLYVVDGKRGVKLPSGLYMQYPQLENVIDESSGEKGYKYKLRNGYDRLYGGKLTNNLVQGTARCIMSEAMVRIAKRYQIALSIHDALYIVVPEDEAQEALDFLIEEMCRPPEWMPDIPLAAEGGWGRSIADC